MRGTLSWTALGVFAAFTVATPLAAQVRPQPGTGDARLQSIDYAADQVVQLQSSPGYQVTIELAADEKIESVAVGDSGAWQVTPNRRGDRLFVKALAAGASTNMVVITDTRSYVFDLVPLFGPSPDMAYTVRFRYPPTAVAAGAGSRPADTPLGSYRVSGARAIQPSAMSEDGQRTYMVWGADQSLPAIYVIDSAGREIVANAMMREGTMVIDSVVDRLIFRLDNQTARATRIDRVAR